MNARQNRTRSCSRKRHFLALSLLAGSAAGCASGSTRSSLTERPLLAQTAASGAIEAVPAVPVAAVDAVKPLSNGEVHVKAVGYNLAQLNNEGDQNVIVFAPPVLPSTDGADDEFGVNAFGRLLDQPERAEIVEESGSGGAREQGVDNGPQSPPLPDSSTSPLPAPTAPLSQGQPVDFFVRQALAAHPSIQAARQRVAAELDRVPQVTALPDPQFNNTFWPLHKNSVQTAGGRIANQMSLQQGVPFPDKLRTRGEIVGREAQMAQAEVERIERQITESVKLAYYEVWYATRAIAIIEETRDLVDDLTKVAEARYRSGGSQQDVLRAQLETDRLDDQLIQLKRQKEVSQADLAALLQQPVSLLAEATEELGVADAPMQLDALIAQAEQCNPSLRGLAAEIQRDRQKQRLACLQQYPDFMVGLNWGIVSDNHDVLSRVADGNDNLSITFGTTLPVWRDKINAGIREAGRRTSSTTQRLEAERDEIYGRLRRLLAQADAFVEQTDVYEDRIIPRTEDTLKLAIADYRGERTDFFTLIETYRELLMFEIQLARINASLAGAIAQIDRTVGCPY